MRRRRTGSEALLLRSPWRPSAPSSWSRGGKAPLDIALQVNKGFHVNSNKPNDELLLPTVVHLNPPQGIMIVNIQYPEGEQLALAFHGQ